MRPAASPPLRAPSTGGAPVACAVGRRCSSARCSWPRARAWEGLTIGELAADLDVHKSSVFALFGSKPSSCSSPRCRPRARSSSSRSSRRGWQASRGLARLQAIGEAWCDYLGSDVFAGGCFLCAASAEMDGRPGRGARRSRGGHARMDRRAERQRRGGARSWRHACGCRSEGDGLSPERARHGRQLAAAAARRLQRASSTPALPGAPSSTPQQNGKEGRGAPVATTDTTANKRSRTIRSRTSTPRAIELDGVTKVVHVAGSGRR